MKAQNTLKSAVGILIPTYNRSAYLRESLASATAQSHGDVEILVLDNAASGEVAQLIASLRDPRIRYVRNEQNLGLIGSIRKGMGLFSEGVAWCTVLPDDDLLDRGFVRAMMARVAGRADMDVVESRRVLIGAEGEILSEAPAPPPERVSAADFLASRSRFARQTFLAGVFFSRAAYDAAGGYPQFATGMASDDALIFALALRRGLYGDTEAAASIRMHPDAESHVTANAAGNIRAFGDFHRYVIAKARACPNLTRDEVSAIRRAATLYTKVSVNDFWMRRCRDLLLAEGADPARALRELYALGLNPRYPLSSRIRLSALLGRLLHVHLERSERYRRFWDSLFRIRTRGHG